LADRRRFANFEELIAQRNPAFKEKFHSSPRILDLQLLDRFGDVTVTGSESVTIELFTPSMTVFS
jgi:hypothetical protein